MIALALTTALLAASSTGAQAATPAPANRADVAAQVAAQFARLDSNADGRVTRDERQTARGTDGGGSRFRPLPDQNTTPDREAGAGQTLAEMQARALARFDRVDTNRNGVIEPGEREAARERRAERKQRSASDQ